MKLIVHNNYKNKMKNITLILILLFLSTSSCKAQVVSLETMAQCSNNPQTCPNATYLKDLNNSLNKYVGTWRGNLNGKKYEYNFIKQLNFGVEDDYRWDRLVGRLRITDSNGNILYNTFTEPDDLKTKFGGDNFQQDLNAYVMNFVGNSIGCVEYGDVYLIIKPAAPNVMYLIMIPDNDISEEGSCPPTFQPSIPYKKTITLTKQ